MRYLFACTCTMRRHIETPHTLNRPMYMKVRMIPVSVGNISDLPAMRHRKATTISSATMMTVLRADRFPLFMLVASLPLPWCTYNLCRLHYNSACPALQGGASNRRSAWPFRFECLTLQCRFVFLITGRKRIYLLVPWRSILAQDKSDWNTIAFFFVEVRIVHRQCTVI